MGLTKIKLGDLITDFSVCCDEPNLTPFDVSGVNKDKEFFEPSVNVGKDTTKYKVVPPLYFACNLMHVGRDVVLPIAYNHSDKNKIVSPAYSVFRIMDEAHKLILDEFFFMCLKRSDTDRYFWMHTDASIRDGMSWDSFCDMEISLPPLSVQQKYVNIYKAMVENQKAYERGLEDLKLVCDGYIEDLRRRMPCEKIGKYIKKCDEKNVDGSVTLEQGININKIFINPQRPNSNLYGRQIVRRGQFAYCTQLNNENVAIAYREGPDCVVSSVYDVFEISSKNELIPGYLMIWLCRSEFGRFQYWASTGSAYEFLAWSDLCDYKIPIPDIKVQQAIADIYNVYVKRREINERLKQEIKEICPVLVKGALEEGARSDG